MTLSRRLFVQAGAAALTGLGLYRLYRHYRPDRPAPRHVILLYQEGGADGLSMIVPHGEPVYYAARPRLAVPRTSVIDLDGRFGLHPALSALQPFWQDRTLAVLPAVGIPQPPRSHFAARARLAQAIGAESGFECGTTTGLREHLQHLATQIERDDAPQLAVVRTTGWDTHWDQGGTDGALAARLRELGAALAGFASRLRSRFDDVLVMTISEFGRTVTENSNGGTDHGVATAMLAVGGRVDGGRVLGGWPPPDPTPASGVPIATDLRHVFAELLSSPAAAVPPAPPAPLAPSNASGPSAATHVPLGIVRN